MTRTKHLLRSFRPFWITLIVSVIALAWDYHVRHAPNTYLKAVVTIEGEPPTEGITVDVDGERRDLGTWVPVGFAKIRFWAPGCEAKTFTRLIRYGFNNLGVINLARQRGGVRATATPAPTSYKLTGKLGTWTNLTGLFENVPYGSYDAVFRYDELFEFKHINVLSVSNEVQLDAKIGALELSATTNGDFELTREASSVVRKGSFPKNFPYIQSGKYRLLAKLPDYVGEIPVEIRRNETNRVLVKPVHGSVLIKTRPDGAALTLNQTFRGKSPLTLTNLIPGRHLFVVELPEFDTQRVEIDVAEESTQVVEIVLVNSRYRTAMTAANLNRMDKQFELAARMLEEALVAQPQDAAALKLLPEMRGRALLAQAGERTEKGDYGSALSALEAALKNLPGDPEVLSAQERVQALKVQSDQEARKSRFDQALADAKAAAGKRDFTGALAKLSDAKGIFPDDPTLPELESAYRKGSDEVALEAAEKKRLDEIASRKRDLQRIWTTALSREKDSASFPLKKYKTTKPAVEVLAALERIGKQGLLYKFGELNSLSANVFTAKMGEIAPGYVGGRYIRIGVATHEKGTTEVIYKIFDYAAGAPETSEFAVNRHFAHFFKTLSDELGGDLN